MRNSIELVKFYTDVGLMQLVFKRLSGWELKLEKLMGMNSSTQGLIELKIELIFWLIRIWQTKWSRSV